MKVKIIQCSKPDFWYHDKIGEIFELSDTGQVLMQEDYYKIIQPRNRSLPWVFKKDVILLNRKEKLERILNEN